MQIRIWKLGNLEHKIFPKKKVFDRFKKEVLDKWDKRSDLDIIWADTLELTIVDTDKEIVLNSNE